MLLEDAPSALSILSLMAKTVTTRANSYSAPKPSVMGIADVSVAEVSLRNFTPLV